MSIALCFVMLKPNARVNSKRIVEKLAELFPALPKAKAVKADQPGHISVSLGEDYEVLMMLMPMPIPHGDLEGPIQTTMFWENAEEEIAKHTGHLVMTVVDQSSDDDVIMRNKVLTVVAAALLASCPEAIGVYNGNAGMIIPSEAYVGIAKEFLPKELPIPIWIDFRAGKNDDGLTAGFTVGLKELGHMEFETHNATDSPGDLRERMMNLASYVLENGPVIQDGHTIGADENEKITVSYSPSEFGHEDDVMMLDYRPTRPKKRR
jgi:hypothetical protein